MNGGSTSLGATDMTQMLHAVTALVQQNAQVMAMLATSMSRSQTPASEASGIQNYNVMPDLSKTIDDFDGEKGPVEAEEWLRQVRNAAQLHNWPAAFTYQTARSHLVGAAKYWLKGRKDITNWEQLMAAFNKTHFFQM